MQTNDPGITGLFDTPATGEVERYLTREEQAAFLREQYGFPVTKNMLDKEAMRGTGPAEVEWGKWRLSTPSDGLKWARSRFRARRRV
jgi:hypothetical protein